MNHCRFPLHHSFRPVLASSLMVLTLCSALTMSIGAAEQNAAKLTPVLTNQPGGGRSIVFGHDPAAARTVAYIYRGQFSYVRIEQQELGAEPNDHPAVLDTARIRDRLMKVMLNSGKVAIFSEEELAEITPHLVTALAQATAGQDVTFAVSGKHGYLGLLTGRSVTTARVFVRKKQLNLIFGLVHADFEQQFQASGFLRPFMPGTRASEAEKIAIGITEKNPGETNLRNDWVALSIDSGAAVAGTPLSVAAQSAPVTPRAAQAVTAPSSSPVTAAPSNGAIPANTASKGDELYLMIRERLKTLDKLKADGLITEQEYQDKRKAILKDL